MAPFGRGPGRQPLLTAENWRLFYEKTKGVHQEGVEFTFSINFRVGGNGDNGVNLGTLFINPPASQPLLTVGAS